MNQVTAPQKEVQKKESRPPQIIIAADETIKPQVKGFIKISEKLPERSTQITEVLNPIGLKIFCKCSSILILESGFIFSPEITTVKFELLLLLFSDKLQISSPDLKIISVKFFMHLSEIFTIPQGVFFQVK